METNGALNVCAGPFGAVYDFYIERPRVAQAVGRVLWGIDTSVLYAGIESVGSIDDGATVIDVPCGGGVAFRALRPEQDVRYLAGDLSAKMLERARVRARDRAQVQLIEADMTALPFADAEADLFLSFSGLHMIHEPERAVAEAARCLRPGGRLIGTAFLAEGTRRARAWFGFSARFGHPLPPACADLHEWLLRAGFEDLEINPRRGFAAFSAVKRTTSSE